MIIMGLSREMKYTVIVKAFCTAAVVFWIAYSLSNQKDAGSIPGWFIRLSCKVASYLADFDTRWPHEYKIFNFARFSSRIW